MKKNVAIGSDHAGYVFKYLMINKLRALGYDVKDYGADSEDSVDYPDYAHAVSKAVSQEPNTVGVLICGSGNGVCMTANKYPNIRAALAWNRETSMLARQHNDANIICIPARFISQRMSVVIAQTFFETEFEGGRHSRRVGKITKEKNLVG